MRQYEMTYLVSDKVSDADMNAATGKINALITSHKGKVLGEENWGRRKLAYPIAKQDFATYVTLNFELKPEELSKINRELRLSKEIVRSLILVKDFGKEKITLTAEEVAEASEIEEVVGGERSFEAVEGETEESYDLMATRQEAVEESSAEEKAPEAAVAEETTPEEKVEVAEKPAKETKKTEEAAAEEKIEVAEEATPEKEEKAAAKKKTTKKKVEKVEVAEEKEKKAEAEADRLAKLDEEIEGILGDDL